MIKENNFDGIILSVNREKTSFISEYLLKNKLNLLTEKPSALTSTNAKNLKNFAAKNPSIYLTGYMKRHDYGVKKLLFLGSSCIYPKHPNIPITEDQLMIGPLESSNSAYAIAKIAGMRMCQAYRQQYGFNAISLMPTNLYGPGDHFDGF